MMDVIKVGIAGLGRSGWDMHARALADLPEMYRITAVADPRPERRQEAQDRFGCQTTTEFAALLANDEVDLLVIATPSHVHADQTVAALQAGKHVMVEKPMALTIADVDRMMAAAKTADRLLTVNQNYRYQPDFRKVQEVLASGKLGEVVQIRVAVHQFGRRWDWQTLTEYGGGILNNHGVHWLDMMLQLVADDDLELFCHMVRTPLYAGDAESHAKLILRPQNGPLIDMELTHANAYGQNTWLVMATQGSLTGTRRELRWKYFDPQAVPPLQLDREPTPDRSYNRELLPWIEEVCDLSQTQTDGMVLLYRELYGALRGERPLAITPESVRRLMLVLAKSREISNR
ncbi:MAG: Gfo/Idh/MocA family oxidoreductase [Ardenticatenaceae bacterium]|nr:Gfo/Idh/MocA family oxidoreductase [Ardenticatenaceae bacterium]